MNAVMSKPHWLYEFRDSDGAYLYIGITSVLTTRLAGHARKPWWPEVSRIEIDQFPNRVSVLAEEATRIARHQPKYNVAGSEQADPHTGWNARRENIAAAHAAGLICRDQICKDCVAAMHAANLSCFKPFHCSECAGFMPYRFHYDQPREADCWRELVRRHGGERANALTWTATGAFAALCIDEDDSAWVADRQRYALQLALESARVSA